MIISISDTSHSFNWLEIAGNILPPFVALGGAIFLYFRQRKADRADELRKARMELYSEYLDALSIRYKGTNELTPAKAIEPLTEFGRYHNKLLVLAPKDVVLASRAFMQESIQHAFDDINSKPAEFDIDIGKNLGDNMRQNIEALNRITSAKKKYNAARRELVIAMRRDLQNGTGETPFEIEDLWGEETK